MSSKAGAAFAPDPLDRVFSLGAREARTGMAIGLVVALSTHGGGAARALASPIEMQKWSVEARARIHEHLWATYDVDLVKPATPEPEKPEEKSPEREPPAPAPIAKAAPKATAEPAPAAAQAARVLTAAPTPDEPVDLTGQGFVQGNAAAYAGGVTAAAGTSTAAVYDKNARPDGVVGGRGTQPAAPVDEGPDRSRGASVAPGSSWSSCPFPAEADSDQVDFARVTIVVTVRADGTAQSVRVVADPGHGFGRAARQCALSQRFEPAYDRTGAAIVGTTPPIVVKFTR